MGYKRDAWLEMFAHATKDDYSFLYLNSKKPRRLRCMKNFDRVLFHEESEVDEYDDYDERMGKLEKNKKRKLN